jgi:hypothetical protein
MESELLVRTNTLAIEGFLAVLSHASAQPAITRQPQDQTAIAGTTATFTVEATGKDPLRVCAPRHGRRPPQAQDYEN